MRDVQRHRRSVLAVLALVSVLVLSSCGSGSDAGPPSSRPDGSRSDGSDSWLAASITDVDGQNFRIADLAGRPVFVELFATWCPTCRAQLKDTNAAARSLGSKAVVVALSVETTLRAEKVKEYAADNGFTDIRFAVLTNEQLAAFVEAFGNGAANPPGTPHFVVKADGTLGPFETGRISLDRILAQLGPSAGPAS